MRRARSLVEGEGMVGLESCIREHPQRGLLDFIAYQRPSSSSSMGHILGGELTS